MKIFADLEIHSKYARAVSKDMTTENLGLWGLYKGINVIGTGDFTHPLWFKELKEKLEPAEPGLLKLKNRFVPKDHKAEEMPRFLLTAEVSCIYSKGGRVRKVHQLLYAPSFEAVEKINTRLGWIGNLKADGRPILGLDSKELLKIILDTPGSVLIPAHVWTPWFGIFGSMSGFNSLEECFEELTKNVFAIETGLSSDPPMNWRIKWLDGVSIISSSDAHSLPKIGREACLFDTELSYSGIMDAIKSSDPKKFLYTLEFYPEEGMYHYSGHRAHNIVYSPNQEKEKKAICEVCGKPVTRGVMSRIEELADPARKEGYVDEKRIPYKNLVPLQEIIAEAFDQGVGTKKVVSAYKELIGTFGSEFKVLLDANINDLIQASAPEIGEGIKRVREGKLHIEPGYDGVYGEIKIFEEAERKELSKKEKQSALF
ncbi:DNA helicase UvrD [Candidatus Parcubacteria bacterium]|nr:MAG: DNA helicase UvrD [Candidatus Parcubacteria bacterium]